MIDTIDTTEYLKINQYNRFNQLVTSLRGTKQSQTSRSTVHISSANRGLPRYRSQWRFKSDWRWLARL